MKKTVGFFGGSFDPLHFGHIHLAIQLSEIHHLDEVLFCPAFCSPFKTASPPKASPEHRLQMLRLGLEDIPQFKITSLEIEQKGPSYTIDTLRHLQAPNLQFRLLLSRDVALHLDQWKDFLSILRLAPPLIGLRGEAEDNLLPELKPGLTTTPMLDISSTEIRGRLAQKLYCGHLVPAKTLDYIHTHRLYCA
jgi:nicotinate-nucleotide adenylyltransferase